MQYSVRKRNRKVINGEKEEKNMKSAKEINWKYQSLLLRY